VQARKKTVLVKDGVNLLKSYMRVSCTHRVLVLHHDKDPEEEISFKIEFNKNKNSLGRE
jgi:hypothetical protein